MFFKPYLYFLLQPIQLIHIVFLKIPTPKYRACFRIEADLYLHHLVEVGLYTQYDNKNENHYQYMYNEYLNQLTTTKWWTLIIDSIIILVLIILHPCRIQDNKKGSISTTNSFLYLLLLYQHSNY